MKRSRKLISILLTLALLAAMMVPLAAPAAAKSLISTDRVIAISDDFDLGQVGSNVTIREDLDFSTDWSLRDTFRIVLPSGIKWNTNATAIYANGNQLTLGTDYFKRTNQVIEVVLPAGAVVNNTPGTKYDSMLIKPAITVDGGTGDVTLTVDPMDSGMSAGSVVFATIGSGVTTGSVSAKVKIGTTSTDAGTIEIRESSASAIPTGASTLRLKLPPNFEWGTGMVSTDIKFSGGLTGSSVNAATFSASGRDLFADLTIVRATPTRGSIFIETNIKATASAAKGDVTVSVLGTASGGKVWADYDLIPADYSDYGTILKVAEVKELKSGKFGQKTAKITVEENIAGSLITRDLHIALPSWVKITQVSNWAVSGVTAAAPTVTGTRSFIDIPISAPSTGAKGKIEFTMELSAQADMEGDIEATISGAGVTEETIVIATATKSVDAVVNSSDVKVGIQEQAAPDIVITEKIKGAISKSHNVVASGTNGELLLVLTEGVQFSKPPTVTVTSGNLEVDKNGIAFSAGNKSELVIPIKSDGTNLAEITISDVKLTLNRSVPEGPIFVKIGGSAIVENAKGSEGYLNGSVVGAPPASPNAVDEGEFDAPFAVVAQIANVITPADEGTKIKADFVIGSNKYIVGGVEKEMDVTPYIKDGRTFLPVRFVAEALGVANDNILWDGANQTVTILKGDKVVQMKIGSKTMIVSGVAITMDVAPEITNDRTMLPFRFIAQALGATVSWDEATQTVTLN